MSTKVVKLNVKEASARLGLSGNKVRKLIHSEALPAEDHGTDKRPYYLVRLDDLEAYEASRRVRRREPVVEYVRPKPTRRVVSHGWFDAAGRKARTLHDL